MAKKKIAAFKIGNWTDKNGKKLSVTKDILDKIVNSTKSFSYQDNQFPIVIGHPKENSPAWGWINKNDVSHDGEILTLEYEEENLNPDFKEWVKQKLYKNVSISLRPDLSIYHLGFLGANPPAVTGLPSVQFSNGDDILEFEFEEYEIPTWWTRTVGTAIRAFKNYVIEKDGNEKANSLIPDYVIDELSNPPKIKPVEANKLYSEEVINKNKNSKESLMENLTAEQINKLQNDNQNFSEKINQLTSQLTDLQTKLNATSTENTQLKLAAKRSEYLSFLEGPEVSKKIKPAEKESFVQLLASADSLGSLEFSEGNEAKKIAPVELVKGLIKNQPDLVPEGEFANKENADLDFSEVDVSEFAEKNVDPDRMELHKKALAISKRDNISYEDAVKKAMTK